MFCVINMESFEWPEEQRIGRLADLLAGGLNGSWLTLISDVFGCFRRDLDERRHFIDCTGRAGDATARCDNQASGFQLGYKRGLTSDRARRHAGPSRR